MKRVLFVLNAGEFGGLEIVLLDWLSAIEYSKVSVALCYRADVLLEKLTLKQLPVETVKLTIPDREPFWNAFSKWLRVFSSVRPHDLIFLEGSLGDFGLIPMIAARLSTRGTVSLFAGGGGAQPPVGDSAVKRRLYYGFLPGIGLYRLKQILKQKIRNSLLHQTFVSSRGFKDNLVAYLRYPVGRTSILYHGVDIGRFKPSIHERAQYRRAIGIPEDATVIVSHGRLAPVKRVDRILKAFATLSSEYANLWLLMTSYGPMKDEVERVVAGNEAFRRVKLVGFQEDTSKLLQAGDIYVLASDREGFGIALIEAMSTGLVCVATNCQGPAGIVANGGDGILVEPTDEGVLEGLRRALCLRPEERGRIAAQARKTVEDRFEIHAAVRRALDSMEIPSR
jgi:glycosyltransferase involved in cell wall biosynthesis